MPTAHPHQGLHPRFSHPHTRVPLSAGAKGYPHTKFAKAAVRLDELRRLRAEDAPSPEQRARIALLEAGEAADTRAVADSKLVKGGGLAAVRLDELRWLRAVVAPSPEQRARIALLEAGEAADTRACFDRRGSHPKNPKATWQELAQFKCMPNCRFGGIICAAIGYTPEQLDPMSRAPKPGAVPARVKIPESHKECFGGKTPSRSIVNEKIDFSKGQRGGVAGWPGKVSITRIRRT